jgi:hypothetical protein
MSRRWTYQRAARLGYLAGRGLSIESIMADELLAAYSEFSVRKRASNWRIPLGRGVPFTLVIAGDDRERLYDQAARLNTSARELAAAIVRNVLRDHMVDAVIDGEKLEPQGSSL